MGFSVVTSEAEHFLIWLLSMCNLSFVNFLVIPSPPLPRSLSPPRAPSETVRGISAPETVREPRRPRVRKTQSGARHRGAGHFAGRSWTASDGCCEEAPMLIFFTL